jgi:hypothetical protein
MRIAGLFTITKRDLLGVRFALNVLIASALLWYLLRHTCGATSHLRG